MPLTAADFRRIAVSLPDAFESSHMDHPDFRIASSDGKGRIFATLSGERKGLGVLKLTLDQQTSFCEELPDVFEPVQGGWGRMGMTYVHLAAVEEDTLLGALTTAHRNVAAAMETAKSKRASTKRVSKKAAVKRAKPKIKK